MDVGGLPERYRGTWSAMVSLKEAGAVVGDQMTLFVLFKTLLVLWIIIVDHSLWYGGMRLDRKWGLRSQQRVHDYRQNMIRQQGTFYTMPFKLLDATPIYGPCANPKSAPKTGQPNVIVIVLFVVRAFRRPWQIGMKGLGILAKVPFRLSPGRNKLLLLLLYCSSDDESKAEN